MLDEIEMEKKEVEKSEEPKKLSWADQLDDVPSSPEDTHVPSVAPPVPPRHRPVSMHRERARVARRLVMEDEVPPPPQIPEFSPVERIDMATQRLAMEQGWSLGTIHARLARRFSSDDLGGFTDAQRAWLLLTSLVDAEVHLPLNDEFFKDMIDPKDLPCLQGRFFVPFKERVPCLNECIAGHYNARQCVVLYLYLTGQRLEYMTRKSGDGEQFSAPLEQSLFWLSVLYTPSSTLGGGDDEDDHLVVSPLSRFIPAKLFVEPIWRNAVPRPPANAGKDWFYEPLHREWFDVQTYPPPSERRVGVNHLPWTEFTGDELVHLDATLTNDPRVEPFVRGNEILPTRISCRVLALLGQTLNFLLYGVSKGFAGRYHAPDGWDRRDIVRLSRMGMVVSGIVSMVSLPDGIRRNDGSHLPSFLPFQKYARFPFWGFEQTDAWSDDQAESVEAVADLAVSMNLPDAPREETTSYARSATRSGPPPHDADASGGPAEPPARGRVRGRGRGRGRE